MTDEDLFEFHLPDVGEGLQEAEVLTWYVETGDVVEEDEDLLEVETDKAVVDLPSPVAGTVAEIVAEFGDRVEVGELLVRLEPTAEGDAGSVVGSLPESDEPTQTDADQADAETDRDSNHDSGDSNQTTRATPATRRLANELEVDLDSVEPTGDDNRVTEEDVRRAADQSENQTVPLQGVRGAIARRLQMSQGTIPQATLMDEVDVVPFLEATKKYFQDNLPLTALITYLVADLLDDFPRFNARFDEDGDEFRVLDSKPISIAVDADEGLMVPVIDNVDGMDWEQLRDRVGTVVRQTQDDKPREQVHGGGMTISNVGPYGGRWATPLINPPQASILALGAIEKRPLVVEETVQAREALPLSLTFDHRLIDGSRAAEFLEALAARLSDELDWLPGD